MVATANTKIMVRPASRMFSAISFGVFCRSAPSTSAIMRSRKVEPWAAVIFTLIQSESTRVPPVTAERSPPLSRMTGADSPVIADSSTEATPSITSPSLGMKSPASTSTRSPGLRTSAETFSHLAGLAGNRRLAWVSVRIRRRFSACALPRPSATASAKFANTTVNHSQKAIWAENRTLVPTTASRMTRMVVNNATISTTNMTGLRHSVRGSSLWKESTTARPSRWAETPATVFCRPVCRSRDLRPGSAAPRLGASADLRFVWIVMDEPSIGRAGHHLPMLDDGPERERREIDQPAGDDDDSDQQRDEHAVVGRKRARGSRDQLLGRQ